MPPHPRLPKTSNAPPLAQAAVHTCLTCGASFFRVHNCPSGTVILAPLLSSRSQEAPEPLPDQEIP